MQIASYQKGVFAASDSGILLATASGRVHHELATRLPVAKTDLRRLLLHVPEASDDDVVRDAWGGQGTASRVLRLVPPAMRYLLGPLTVILSRGYDCWGPTRYSPCGLATHPTDTTDDWRSSLLLSGAWVLLWQLLG